MKKMKSGRKATARSLPDVPGRRSRDSRNFLCVHATRTLCRMAGVFLPALILCCASDMHIFAAADTAAIDLSRKGSITVTLYSEEKEAPVTDGVLTLYQTAVLSAIDQDRIYTCTAAFESFDLPPEEEPQEALAAWADENQLSGMEVPVDSGGRAVFPALSPGLYLVMQTAQSSGYQRILPFSVAVPLAGTDGWIYDVDASPKVEVYPEPGAGEHAQREAEPDAEEQAEQPGRQPETESVFYPEPETETRFGILQRESLPGSAPSGRTSAGSFAAADTVFSGRDTAPAAVTGSVLPQTGQLIRPVLILAGAGLLAVLTGSLLVHAGRKKRRHEA